MRLKVKCYIKLNLIKHIKLRKNYYLGRDLVFFLTKEKLFKIHTKKQ